MPKLLDEIRLDLSFIRSHQLQPNWYKVLKMFFLLGSAMAYYSLFGIKKTIIFFVVFFTLALLVHFIYRIKTNRWSRSWLDFVVVEEDGEKKAVSIGKYYYIAVALNATISLLISQLAG